MSLVLLLAAAWVFLSVRENWRWASFLEDLDREPGIVLTQAQRRGDRILLAGLRDPLSASPSDALASSNLSGYEIEERWEPYHSFHTEIVSRRAAEVLNPPPSVQIKVQDGIILPSGEATIDWINEARLRLSAVAGASGIDTTQLQQVLPPEVVRLVEAVEESRLLFNAGSSRIQPANRQALEVLGAELARLEDWALEQGQRFEVRVIGHTDPSGSERFNRLLASRRAESVIGELGLRLQTRSPLELSVSEASDVPGGRSPEDQRSVTFAVIHSNER